MNPKIALLTGLSLTIILAGGYYSANRFALKTTATEIKELEPKIRESFRNMGSEWAEGATNFSYKIEGVSLFTKTIDLKDIIISNSAKRRSEKRVISISRLSISQDDKLISINNAENAHVSIGKGYVKFKILNISKVPFQEIKKKIDDKDIAGVFKISKFDSFKINELEFKEKDSRPAQKVNLISVDKLENGAFKNLKIERLNFQEKNTEPKIEIEILSIDKLQIIPEDLIRDDKELAKATADLFGASQIEGRGMSVRENSDSQELKLNLIKITASREDSLINDIELNVSGVEVSKTALLETRILSKEILNHLKKDTFKFKTSVRLNWVSKEGDITSKISAGLDEIGSVSIEAKVSGFSKEIVKGLQESGDFEKYEDTIAFKKIGFSYVDEGLKDIGLRLAEQNGMGRDQIIQMTTTQINSDKNFSEDEKVKFTQAVRTFLNKGSKLSISFSSRKTSGAKSAEIVGAFFNQSLDNVLEVDINSN